MSSEPSAPRPEQADPDLRALVEQIVKSLVDAPGDVGKVIGKQGRTARAFRNVLGAAGMKLDHRFELEILE